MATAFGADRPAALCRELTKTYEQVRRGTLAELVEMAAAGVRGEVTLVVAGATGPVEAVTDEVLAAAVAELVAAGGPAGTPSTRSPRGTASPAGWSTPPPPGEADAGHAVSARQRRFRARSTRRRGSTRHGRLTGYRSAARGRPAEPISCSAGYARIAGKRRRRGRTSRPAAQLATRAKPVDQPAIALVQVLRHREPAGRLQRDEAVHQGPQSADGVDGVVTGQSVATRARPPRSG